MAKKQKIKAAKGQVGQKIKANEPTVNYDERTPLFSLERLQTGSYCLQSLDKDGKSAFADAIFRRRSCSWKEIKQMPKHGLGFEKIARKSIRAPIPAFITPEVDSFLAFRFHGKKPMVGYRQGDIFYILWFDVDFSLYNHG